jgi:hypothetical protein
MAIEVIVNIRAVSTGTQIFGMDREAGGRATVLDFDNRPVSVVRCRRNDSWEANRGHTHDGAHGNRGHASSDFCRVAMHYFRWRWTLESDESLQNIDDGRLRAHFANAASNYERTGSALDLMESRLAAARRLHRRFDGYVVRSSRARLRIL